jgi:hypothetical protein
VQVGNTTAAAAAPGANTNFTVLLDTYTALNRLPLSLHRIEKYVLNLTHSHGGNIEASKSSDGTNWTIYFKEAVAAPTSPEAATLIEIQTSAVFYLRIRWENGGTAQDPWKPDQELVEGDRAAA